MTTAFAARLAPLPRDLRNFSIAELAAEIFAAERELARVTAIAKAMKQHPRYQVSGDLPERLGRLRVELWRRSTKLRPAGPGAGS